MDSHPCVVTVSAPRAFRPRRVGILGAAVLVLGLAVPSVAAEPSNGIIAVGASPPTGIYAMNDDGSDLQRIADSTSMVFTQASSPDGSQILYLRGSGGSNALRIVGIDGTGDRQIVPAGGPVSADWSRDGSTILYTTRFASLVPARVVLIDPDGSNERDVSGLPHAMAGHKLSPDGATLAFWGFLDGSFHLLLADVDLSVQGDVPATNIRSLVSAEHADTIRGIAWSPDGTRIAFGGQLDNPPQPPSWDCGWVTKAQDVFVVDVATGALTNLTNTQGAANAQESYPYFSPDGTRISFVAYGSSQCVNGQLVRQYEARNVFVMHVGGGARIGPYTDFQPQAGSFGVFGGAVPVWLPCIGGSAGCSLPPAMDTDPDPGPDPDPDPEVLPGPGDGGSEVRDVTQACAGAPTGVFVDVPVTQTHRLGIECTAFWGISGGYPDGTYRPGLEVTRAQMASFIQRLILKTNGSLPEATSAFVDVGGSVHAQAIGQLAAAGIVGGYGNGLYGPGDPVTRAQMATFIVRALEYRTGTTIERTVPTFSDHLDSVHRDRIEQLAAIGVTGGDAQGDYDPRRRVDRGQMGSFMARSIAYLDPTGASDEG